MDFSLYSPPALSALGQSTTCPTVHDSYASNHSVLYPFPSSHSAPSWMRKHSLWQIHRAWTILQPSFLLVLASSMGEKTKSDYTHALMKKLRLETVLMVKKNQTKPNHKRPSSERPRIKTQGSRKQKPLLKSSILRVL